MARYYSNAIRCAGCEAFGDPQITLCITGAEILVLLGRWDGVKGEETNGRMMGDWRGREMLGLVENDTKKIWDETVEERDSGGSRGKEKHEKCRNWNERDRGESKVLRKRERK